MSTITIMGTLIQDGNVTCDQDVNITSTGIVIPIPADIHSKSIYSCQTRTYITSTGKSRYIKSLYGDILIEGLIDGDGGGFPANSGPGCNSRLLDNLHRPISGYGATHAGIGHVTSDPGTSKYYDEQITVTGEDLDRNYILLSAAPVDGNIAINPIHGPAQHYPNDFNLDWNKLTWYEMPMEGIVILGEVFRVLYNGSTKQYVPDPKRPYGSFASPLSLGSGSATTAGGGGIWVEASAGTITVNGRILMNGEDGPASINTGGGSGGSVWLNAWILAGDGIIMARGGTASYPRAGGGGGGYISLWYEKANTYSGISLVEGMSGGSDGKVHTRKIEPFFEEKFTGKIWNTKWWEIISEPVTLDNFVLLDASSDPRSPAVQSLFSLSGDIKADISYMPFGTEAGYYTSKFLLYQDPLNWVGLAKKNGYLFGTFCVNGVASQGGVPVDNADLTMRLVKQGDVLTFQYYDSTSTPQTILSESVPELRNLRYKVRLGLDKISWADATTIITEYLAPTSTDLLNSSLTLSALPLDSSSVALNTIEGPAQHYGIDFYVAGQQLKWDRSSLEGGLPGDLQVEYFDLSATDISNKFVNLERYPRHESDVAVSLLYGPPQHNGTDFKVYRKKLFWEDLGMDGILTPWDGTTGDRLVVTYWGSETYIPDSLENILTTKDELRIIYTADTSNNEPVAGFDSFRLFQGTLIDAESKEPVLYVDSVHGSDSSNGDALSPLQNLFVATAWSKKGGTVVLYDGTYNPTEVIGKDLTIMGANGARPVITTAESQDTTGSNWERSCLTFRSCQGRVQNLKMSGASEALTAVVTDNIEVVGCDITDATTGLNFLAVPTEGAIVRGTRIQGAQVGISFSGCYDPCVNSCVISDSSIGIKASDTSHVIITASTLDSDGTAIWLDNTCSGVVASNNLTNCETGIFSSANAAPVTSVHNTFYETATPHGGRPPDVDQSNTALNPLYKNQPARDYRLTISSPNRGAGTAEFDKFMKDFQGLNRSVMGVPDIGAFEYLAGTHSGDWYVSGAVGEDSTHFGGAGDPFRTLDRVSGDGTIHVASGHLDSFHLGLWNTPVSLDGSTATFRTHFSNVDVSRVIYVSPNGNDASGTGAKSDPYKTIDGALADSSAGDYIVVLSGEYPEFTGRQGRTILFQPDRAAQLIDGTSRFLCDIFDQLDLRAFGNIEYHPQWTLDYTGTSKATISDGFLRMLYDGSNTVRANSIFTFEKDFDISADIRNTKDPLVFSVHNADTTMTLMYNNSSYRVEMRGDGTSTFCYGQLSVGPVEDKNFWTDHICLGTDDTREGWAQLSFVAQDCSSSAMNLIGGPPQEYGVDYKLQGDRLVWRGMSLEEILEPGDNVRVIYRARALSEKVRVALSVHGGRLTAKATDGHSWVTLARRDVLTGLEGPWSASFYMDRTGTSDETCSFGRAFVSNFQALALSFQGTDIDREMVRRTERRTVLIYKDRT